MTTGQTGVTLEGVYLGIDEFPALVKPFQADYSNEELTYAAQNTEMVRQTLLYYLTVDYLKAISNRKDFTVYQFCDDGKLHPVTARLAKQWLDQKGLHLEIITNTLAGSYNLQGARHALCLAASPRFQAQLSRERPDTTMVTTLRRGIPALIMSGKPSTEFNLGRYPVKITDTFLSVDQRIPERDATRPPQCAELFVNVLDRVFDVQIKIKRDKVNPPAPVGKYREDKPLGIKAYGSIPHIVGSKLGPGDHFISEGQSRICTESVRDRHDHIIVQEKLDGACTAVLLKDDHIIPLQRNGSPALNSPYTHLKMFHHWAMSNEMMFREILQEGERAVGEWMAMTHGVRYRLPHGPWVLFDILTGQDRLTVAEVRQRAGAHFTLPKILSQMPMDIERVQKALGPHGWHGAVDQPEGAVYRVERHGKLDFIAKWVRLDMVPGKYLPVFNKDKHTWNTWNV